MTGFPADLGPLGESLAARYLEETGYRIIARNYRLGHREIDLIVGREDLVAFVEVKTRSGPGYGHPLQAITLRKRQEIERVARSWVQRHGHRALQYRFDAVGVELRADGSAAIEHVPGAWWMGE